MKKKYTALRVVGAVYKILAILILVAVPLVAFSAFQLFSTEMHYDVDAGRYVFTSISFDRYIFPVIGVVIANILIGVSMWAFSNLLDLLVDTEENTRATAALLQRLMKARGE